MTVKARFLGLLIAIIIAITLAGIGQSEGNILLQYAGGITAGLCFLGLAMIEDGRKGK